MDRLIRLRPDLHLAEILPVLAPEAAGLRWSILDLGEVVQPTEPLHEWSYSERVIGSPVGLELGFEDLVEFASSRSQIVDGVVVGFSGPAPRRAQSDADVIAGSEILVAVIDSSFWLVGGPEALMRRVSEAFAPVEIVALDRFALSTWGRGDA
jgi:hypothetical protein